MVSSYPEVGLLLKKLIQNNKTYNIDLIKLECYNSGRCFVL